MWNVKIKTLNEDVVVAALIAFQQLQKNPVLLKKKCAVPMRGSSAQMVEHYSATRHGFESCWSPEFFSGLFVVA